MDTIAAAMITAVVGIIGGYLVGNRRVKYEQLHERQAEVIAKLCELLAALQRDVANLTSPLQPGDVDRLEQAEAVDRVFGALVDHYRSNEVWLAPHTCEKIETFLPKVSVPLQNYVDDFSERGYPRTSEGRALGIHILREIQPLRRELISEFRAILYPPPWYDAPLRWLERLETRVRKER